MALRRTADGELVRGALGLLLAVGAINAFIGGSYGMSGAGGLRTDWLDGGPFDDYFLPSLILFGVVGGACLAAAVAVFAGWSCARRLAQLAGGIVFGFIGVEMAIIGPAFWMQSLTAIAASAIIALARALPRPGSSPTGGTRHWNGVCSGTGHEASRPLARQGEGP